MCIPYFRGIFMRAILPTGGSYRNKSSIINLDNADGPHYDGIHWISYAKWGDHAVYFDRFGNLRSPKALVRYLDVT